LFGRIKNSSYVRILELESHIKQDDWNTWKPSANNLYQIIDDSILYASWSVYKEYGSIQHIIGKPFFKKWIQSKCDEVVLRLSDADNQSEMIVKHPWNQITDIYLKQLNMYTVSGLTALLITIKQTLIIY
jgi:hypothetical protein